jgi:hypothetical protein
MLIRYALVLITFLCLAAGPATKPAQKTPLPKFVKDEIKQILDEVESSKDFAAGEVAIGNCFDRAALTAPEKPYDTFRHAAAARRMLKQIANLPDAERSDMLKYLRANEDLAYTLIFLLPEQGAGPNYAVLDKLRAAKPKEVTQYVNLTAAMCAVHEKPFTRRTNENSTTSADVVELFDYYVANEKKMFFGLKDVPAELLVWVVDTTASVEEMQWALTKYAGDAKVGARFFDIKYDYDAFLKGSKKKVTEAGFSLQNISKYGGVCADQAYFAMTVGKSIGVPTAYATGSAGEGGHAWVGFLQADRGRGWWNFDEGRYEAYKGVIGKVIEPMSRKAIPDAYVSLMAELIGTKATDRQNAVALRDVAERLLAIDPEKVTELTAAEPFASTVAATLPKPRTPGAPAALERLDAAVKANPGDRDTWLLVAKLAEENKLTLEQKRKWSDLLQRICGSKYPDFTLAVLDPMIRSVAGENEQFKLWEAVLPLFAKRGDLTASIRSTQAELLEKQNKTEQAGMLYMEIITKYANAGPFVLPALSKAEAALVTLKRDNKVPDLYAQAWAGTKPPRSSSPDIAAQSNWSKIGKILAEKLDAAGRKDEADKVRQQMGTKS